MAQHGTHIQVSARNTIYGKRVMFTFDELVDKFYATIEAGKRTIPWEWRKLHEVKVPVYIEAGPGHIDHIEITYINTTDGWRFKHWYQVEHLNFQTADESLY